MTEELLRLTKVLWRQYLDWPITLSLPTQGEVELGCDNIIVTVQLNLVRNKDIMNIIVTVQLNLGRNMDIINIIVTVQCNLGRNMDIINIIVTVKLNQTKQKELKLI